MIPARPAWETVEDDGRPWLERDARDRELLAIQRAMQETPLDAHEARLGARRLATVDTSPPTPLLADRLDPAGHTILFGAGGAGKGVYTTFLIGQLVADGHRVLILDYENHPEEWARRYRGLHGAIPDAIEHVPPLASGWQGRRGAIWSQHEDIRYLADAFRATYVVVDSIVVACGGADPLAPGTPAAYAGALEYIGLPVLSLGHVPKADDLRYPFGSVFWHNLARVTWSLGRQGNDVVLTNRKANNYDTGGRVAINVTWLDGLPREVWERSYSQALGDRVDELLRAEPLLTLSEIVSQLNAELDEGGKAVNAESVRRALHRGIKDDPKRFTVEGTGRTARYRRVA